jgi:hypothetical protein
VCRRSFDGVKNNPDKAKILDRTHPNLECEPFSVSSFSEGPVEGEEHLLRILYSEHHVDKETKEIGTNAFDDASNKGLSVNRVGKVNRADIECQIKEKLSDPRAVSKGHAFEGVVTFLCEDIRSIYVADSSGRRAFGVYDTALHENRSHADIMRVDMPKSFAAKARNDLREKLGIDPKPIALDDIDFG